MSGSLGQRLACTALITLTVVSSFNEASAMSVCRSAHGVVFLIRKFTYFSTPVVSGPIVVGADRGFVTCNLLGFLSLAGI